MRVIPRKVYTDNPEINKAIGVVVGEEGGNIMYKLKGHYAGGGYEHGTDILKVRPQDLFVFGNHSDLK